MKKKRFSEEKMVSILREADSGEKTIMELCRRHGISDVTFLAWRRRFGQMSETAVKRLRELEKDNVRLKRLLRQIVEAGRWNSRDYCFRAGLSHRIHVGMLQF